MFAVLYAPLEGPLRPQAALPLQSTKVGAERRYRTPSAIFLGAGMQANLGDKARKLAVPVWRNGQAHRVFSVRQASASGLLYLLSERLAIVRVKDRLGTRDMAAKATAKTKIDARAVSPIDRHLGARVRARRLEVGLSQEALGERLGVTFQQIQKYENGVNRIAASRLFEIAATLNLGVGEFFPKGAATITADPAQAHELAELDVVARQLSGDGRETLTELARTMLETEKRRRKRK